MAKQEQVTASSPSSTTVPRAPEVGWKGTHREAEVIRHRWQKDWTRHSHRTFQSRKQWRRIRIAAALGGALLLFGLFLYYLLFFPVRVPLLTLVVTDYSWPLPPNAWAHEDLASLQGLDQGATRTWHVRDGSAAWRTQHHGLQQLEEQLEQLAPEAKRSGLLVLYISMHGAVNDSGQPCLLTRESSPLDSGTWLPLRDVLQRVGSSPSLPASVKKLVILDCNRQLMHWNSGQLYNSFADRLPGLVAEMGIRNLVVLNSTSPGQESATAPDLQGTVFGHFLHLGLAGAADLRSEGGNGNGRVSLRELVSYLEKQTVRRTEHFLADAQRPMLIPENPANFDVAWRLNHRTLRNLQTRVQQTIPAQPRVSAAERQELWRRRDELWAVQPYRFDPLAWRDFEQQLLWLEQLAESGPGYDSETVRVARETTRRGNQLVERLARARSQPALRSYAQLFSDRPLEFPSDMPAHSLSMATYLGNYSAEALRQARSAWEALPSDLTENALRTAWEQLRQSELPQPLSEMQYLHFLRRYHLISLWSTTPVLSQAIQLRQTSLQLDVPPALGRLPGDERAHYWVRANLDRADHRRREAEDRLFSGTEPAAGELTELFSPLMYQQAREELTEISRVLALRDEAWSRVLYWAQWLARPQRTASGQQAADIRIGEILLPLVNTLHNLEADLVRSEPDWSGEVEGVRWSAGPLESDLSRYMQELSELGEWQTEQLLDAAPHDPWIVREIDQWLALPLCTWDQRQSLQENRGRRWDELRNSQHDPSFGEQPWTPHRERHDEPGDSEADDATLRSRVVDDDFADPYLLRLATVWTSHPVPAMLQLESAAEPSTDSPVVETPQRTHSAWVDHFEKLGTNVRERLRRLSRDEFLYEAVEPSGPEQSTADRVRRIVSVRDTELPWEVCCRAEARVRAAGGFWFPAPSEDPVSRLRRRDLQQLLLWNGRRALEDSWGSAGLSPEPFFAVVAESYLRGAERLIPPSAAIRDQLTFLSDAVGNRRDQLRQVLSVTASDLLLVDPTMATTTQMVVRPGTSIRDVDSLPPGDWISFLGDQRGRLVETTRVLPTSALSREEGPIGEWEFVLPGESLVDRGPQLEAVTTYRGSEYRTPLLLRMVGGRRVAADFAPPGPAEVTLHGVPRRRASVQFILDCSQSMSEMEDVEAPTSRSRRQKSRMEVARTALETLLQQLAAERAHRVGVRFFGHRVGWSVVESGKLLRQNRYVGEIPETLLPYEDIELVLPLGRFDEAALARVTRYLGSIEPWGETPLYLSLIAALRDFDHEDNDTEQVIVVITDGLNYQFNPPWDAAKGAVDVLEAASGTRVAIHIVGFGIPAFEQAAAMEEFSMIAEATGGSYVSAANASLLLRTLQQLLRPSEFRLLTEAGEVVDQAEVGSSLRVHPTPPLPERFSLAYESLLTPLELRGGERVQLQVSADRGRLELLPVGSERLPHKEMAVVPSGEGAGVLVMAHRPLREETGVRFTVALQRIDRSFLTRPAEVWAEIRPIFPPGAEPNSGREADYVFQDTVFAADQPAPMFHWFAEDWPAEASRAEIRLWVRPWQAPAPDDSIPLLSIADQVPQQGSGFTRPSIPHVFFQARTIRTGDRVHPLRVVVIERHPSPSTKVGDWRIEVIPRPQRIQRQFDSEQNIGLHTFYFPDSDPQALRQHELRFTSRARFRAEGWYLPEPLPVNIADRGDLLQLTPPAVSP
jgi:hypothetical protein